MKNFKEFFNGLLSADGDENSKRKIQNLAIFLLIGIILLIVGGFFSKDSSSNQIENTNAPQKELVSNQEYFDDYDQLLEKKVTTILSKIQGVGRVNVAITYSTSKEIVPAQDVKQNESNTKEQDREGGVRSTIQQDTDSKVIMGDNSESDPLILKVIPPQVSGIIVVTDGANNPVTKIEIARAVSTMLGIPLSKVQVFPMSTN